MKPDTQQVKNLLLDTVTLLCKNSLGYENQLRVEGLLGVAVDDKDVFFLHISENFVNAPEVSQTANPVNDKTTGRQNKGSDSSCQEHQNPRHDIHRSQTPVDSVELKPEPTDSDDDLVIIPSPELRPPDMVAQPATRVAGQRRPPSNPRHKSPRRTDTLMTATGHSASYAGAGDVSVYQSSFAETANFGHDVQYGEPPQKRLASTRDESPGTFEVRQGNYLDSGVGDTENSVERDQSYQQSEWTDIPPGGTTDIKVEMPEEDSLYETDDQGAAQPGPYVWTVAPTSAVSESEANKAERKEGGPCNNRGRNHFQSRWVEETSKRRSGTTAPTSSPSLAGWPADSLLRKPVVTPHRDISKAVFHGILGTDIYSTCPVCHKICSTPSQLRVHMRVHTGEKPYKCGVCGASFSQSGHLHQHMRSHSADRPYKCNVCGAAFNLSHNLNRHQKVHIKDTG